MYIHIEKKDGVRCEMANGAVAAHIFIVNGPVRGVSS